MCKNYFTVNTKAIIRNGTQKKPVAFSPQANYTDWDRRLLAKLIPTFADRGVSRSQRGGSPTVFNLSFLNRNNGTWGAK
jgi:hypothetical protein